MRSVILALLVAGCAAKPISGLTTVPKDTPTSCEDLCGKMGLKLGAVVVIANEVGCVCEKPGGDHAAGASAAAAGAIIAVKRTDVNREEAWAAGF